MRFESSEERRPRDASPVSVVFGVDRCQVFGVAARTTTSATPAAAAAAAFVVWVPLVASPKKHENRFCAYSQAHHAAMSPRENTGGDQLARPRLVHRGVGSSLRMMVQHARVVVVVAPSYYHRYHPYTILLLLLSPACCVSWCVRSRSSGA